jgi:signal transduction histidine kinase
MHEITAVLEIISSISSTMALDEILAEITEKTAQVVGADSCAISHWDRARGTVTVLADYISPEVALPPGEDINDIGQDYALSDFPATAQVLLEHSPQIICIDDRLANQAERDLLKAFQWKEVLMVPMLYKGRAIGLMELYVDDEGNRQFTAETVNLCQVLANQAAIAIQNAEFFAEINAQRDALRQISQRLVRAQEEERRRISRELHDELGQTLTALRVNLDVVHRNLPEDVSPKLDRSLNEASRLAAHTLETARNLSLKLHPPLLDDLGLVSALRWELDRHEQRTNQTVHFEANLFEVDLPPELDITVYRIICEALTNIARHARASHIRVYFQWKNGHIVVGIEDDGRGFDVNRWLNSPLERESLGLASMRERTSLLGGQFKIISEFGHGTRIRARFPLDPSAITTKAAGRRNGS